MKLRIFAVVAALSLLVSAGIASANSGNGEREGDTRFNFGYDAQAQFFLFNTQATDASPYDCTLQNGRLTATYGNTDGGGVIPVEGLSDSGGNVTFGRTEFDLAEEVTRATTETDFIEYPGPENECRISAYAVGAQGHINHGQFMKLFHTLIDMRGRGCLNRWLAQSDLGKGDQQVKTQDFGDPVIGEPGITFTTAIATCDHGKQDTGENLLGQARGNRDKDQDHPGQGQGKGNGHQDEPDEADEADEADEGKGAGHGRPGSPGKSNDAHGRPDK